MEQLTVSKFANLVGTTPDTLRYYERIGLLPRSGRTAAGYRLYDGDAADRFRFIKGAQRFGLRLEEIGELLGIRERGQCPCGHTRSLLERRLASLDEELIVLGQLRADIQQMVTELPAKGETDWPCGGDLLQIRPRRRRGGPSMKGDT